MHIIHNVNYMFLSNWFPWELNFLHITVCKFVFETPIKAKSNDIIACLVCSYICVYIFKEVASRPNGHFCLKCQYSKHIFELFVLVWKICPHLNISHIFNISGSVSILSFNTYVKHIFVWGKYADIFLKR